MRVGRALPSVMTMSHPQSYEILLVPAFADGRSGAAAPADQKPAADGKSAADTAVGPGAAGESEAAAETKATGTGDSRSVDTGFADPATPAGADPGKSGTQGTAPQDTGSRAAGTPRPGTAIRSAIVAATGETGESGYPRYAGDGMVADIDPATHTVEALLIDGSELDYGLSVRVSERNVNG